MSRRKVPVTISLELGAVPDERDGDGLPRWVDTPAGWACGDQQSQIFALSCVMDGFHLPAFDRWLSRLDPGEAKLELLERRRLAMAADRENAEDRRLRHLEYMLLRWQAIAREAVLLPLARSRKRSSDALAVRRHRQHRKIRDADYDRARGKARTKGELANMLNVSRTTLYEYEKRRNSSGTEQS